MSNYTLIKQEIQFLGDILKNIESGKLRIPRFQRPFVWKASNMIDLFDSIYRGYSIGSLLFWRTKPVYKSLEKLANLFPLTYEKNEEYVSYVLDGQQRISTLFGILANNWSEETTKELNGNKNWNIYFDMKEKVFLHIVKKTEKVQPHYFYLRNLLNTRDFLKESRRIQKECGDEAESYIDEAEKMQMMFKDYKIAVTVIEGGDIETATNVYTRANTTGVKMNADQIHTALTYQEGEFNLSDELDNISNELVPYYFDNIERKTIFRCILAAAGKNIDKESKWNLLTDVKDLLELVEDVKKATKLAANFLYNDLHIAGSNFLPYQLQFIIVTNFFRICPNPKEEQIAILRKWFWVTSFAGLDLFNTTKRKRYIDEISTFAAQTEIDESVFREVDFQEQARAYPEILDMSSARGRAFLLFLTSLKPQPLDLQRNQNLSLDELKGQLANSGYKCIANIHTGKSSPENRMIVVRTKGGYLKTELTNFCKNVDMNDSLQREKYLHILESHAITEEAKRILVENGDIDAFLKVRQTKLMQLERNFLQEKGVEPYTSDIPEDGIKDFDGEALIL